MLRGIQEDDGHRERHSIIQYRTDMDVSRDINRTPRPRSRSSTRTLTPSARARSVSPWRATHSKLNLRQFGRSRRGPVRRRWDAVTRTTVEWDSLAHVGRSSFVPVPNRLQIGLLEPQAGIERLADTLNCRIPIYGMPMATAMCICRIQSRLVASPRFDCRST